jgi:O-methyltransferase involved in polyketide biosynthesis
LSGVPQTSLLALYGRAKISNECGSLFNNAKAVELVERIDYDFSFYDLIALDYVLFSAVARAIQLDNKVKTYIKEHPHASVVNLGAGFETEFYRVDNGTIHWYDLDLLEVIEVRKQLISETNRATCIAKSFLDPSWCTDINTKDGVFIIAGGIFHYFHEAEVRQLFLLLADHIPGCEIVFDAESKSIIDIDGNCGAFEAGWSDDSPEKRDAMQAECMRMSKNAWNMLFSQDLLDKIIGALTTSTKPQSAEWNDFETWWNQLSAQEKSKAMSDLSIGSPVICRSPLEDASDLTTWDNRITVIDQFPLCRNIPRDPSLSRSIQQFMDYTDEKGRIKIFHVRV